MIGATAAAAVLPAVAAAAAEPVLEVVDTHQHLWDLERFKLPWLDGAPKLNRSFRSGDYRQAVDPLAKATPPARLVQAVYMEVDVLPAQQQAEADFAYELCRRGDTLTVAAVVGGHPASASFAAYVRPFRGSRFIKGVRQVLHGASTPAGFCLREQFVRGVRLLGELGLSFDLCLRAGELADAARLIDRCPDTRFILDHCGNADLAQRRRAEWKQGIAAVARRPNVVGKVSGIIASAPQGRWTIDDLAPVIEHTLDVFGPDRVMFGGDWPVCTLAASFSQWFDALRTVVASRPAEQQRKLFHDNAVKFYGL